MSCRFDSDEDYRQIYDDWKDIVEEFDLKFEYVHTWANSMYSWIASFAKDLVGAKLKVWGYKSGYTQIWLMFFPQNILQIPDMEWHLDDIYCNSLFAWEAESDNEADAKRILREKLPALLNTIEYVSVQLALITKNLKGGDAI